MPHAYSYCSAAICALFSWLGCVGDVSPLFSLRSHGCIPIATVVEAPTGPNRSGLDVLSRAVHTAVNLRVELWLSNLFCAA
jgi:hypothetical protein